MEGFEVLPWLLIWIAWSIFGHIQERRRKQAERRPQPQRPKAGQPSADGAGDLLEVPEGLVTGRQPVPRPSRRRPEGAVERPEGVGQRRRQAAVAEKAAAATRQACHPLVAGRLTANNLRRAVVLSEILAPPVSLRHDR